MKKYLEYIGILALALFSFYYTDKVTKIMNDKDPIMISIKEYKENTKETCKEGYYTNDGVVLGVNGKIVDTNESYSNMVSKGYDETLMVFKEVKCNVRMNNTLDNYIVKGNEVKSSISLFILVKDLTLLDKIINISDTYNIKLNILVNGKLLNQNKEYFKKLYLDNYDIIYNGNNKEDLELYIKNIKSFSNNDRLFCMSYKDIDNKEICNNKKINTLKTNYIYDKNILNNTIKNFEKGGFYIYKENNILVNELSSIINYINGKNQSIVNISDMLN